MIEIEKTYLAKYIPKSLADCKSKEIIDIYFPKSVAHPKLRVRSSGQSYEITKKEIINGNDSSHQTEQTIILTKEEFNELLKIDSKKVKKIRYYYPYDDRAAEIDVFKNTLEGLVLVDFEFNSLEERDVFKEPDFCLADVTQEEFIAGGMLCGKSYEDIEKNLKKYNYLKLFLNI